MITNLKNELSEEIDTTEKISTYLQPLLQDPEYSQLADDIERLNLNSTYLGKVINKNKKILFDETKIKLVVPFLLRPDDDHLTLLPGKIIDGFLPPALSKELVDSMDYEQLSTAISNTVKIGYINFSSFEMDLPFLIALTKTELGSSVVYEKLREAQPSSGNTFLHTLDNSEKIEKTLPLLKKLDTSKVCRLFSLVNLKYESPLNIL